MESHALRRHSLAILPSPRSSLIEPEQFSVHLSTAKLQPVINETIKQGWCMQSTCCFNRFQKTYLVLSQNSLKTYKDEQKTLLTSCLNFDLYSFSIETLPQEILKISAFSLKKSFKLKFSKESQNSWFCAISDQIALSYGSRYKISRTLAKEKFWHNYGISEAEFLSNADSGDLIFFRSKNYASMIQRCFMRGKYDHMAIIVRFSNGEVGFLEASRAYGVVFTYWDKFFKKEWRNHYREIAYRKLDLEKSPEEVKELEKFVNNARGKVYKLRFRSQETHGPGEEDTFFCSELVASAYKVLGLLDSKLPSYKFYPGHFIEESNLKLLKGSLLPEQKIDMDYTLTNN